MNQNSNTTTVAGNGSVTNNNWAINIMHAYEEQVGGLIGLCLRIVDTLYTRRHLERSLLVRHHLELS